MFLYTLNMKKNGPWTIKSSEVKYKNPWLELQEDQVIRPDGKDGVYAFVTFKRGISVLALDDNRNTYLVEEFKYPAGEDTLGAVGGSVDGNESPLDAAKRELREEAGIEADEWVELGTTNSFTSMIDGPERLFLARKLSFTQQHLDGTEAYIKVKKVPLAEAVAMVMDSRIVNTESCVLILKANEYIRKAGV